MMFVENHPSEELNCICSSSRILNARAPCDDTGTHHHHRDCIPTIKHSCELSEWCGSAEQICRAENFRASRPKIFLIISENEFLTRWKCSHGRVFWPFRLLDWRAKLFPFMISSFNIFRTSATLRIEWFENKFPRSVEKNSSNSKKVPCGKIPDKLFFAAFEQAKTCKWKKLQHNQREFLESKAYSL